MINCPNPSCESVNPEGAKVCQVCQSALPHYYLWGVGELVGTLRPGTLLNQRYLLKHDSVFLDTKPGLIPDSLPELPKFLQPYLHLSVYPLHVPRPYAVMRTPDEDYVLMLESSALAMAGPAGMPTGKVPSLLPELSTCWPDAPPLKQLNWLWQIAQLWEACLTQDVATTLLAPSLIRVDGSIVRLLALISALDDPAAGGLAVPSAAGRDTSSQASALRPTLMDLARQWQPLAETAHSAVSAFLQRLCERLERQQLTAEQLTECLSQAMTVCSQRQQVSYDLAVFTDQGPTRKRNEDACYPPGGTHQALTSEVTKAAPQLLIVCDGIGGHQGGDVASKLAIATIEARLSPILQTDDVELTATEVAFAIEAAICAANDEISAQNDQAQRQARDRMGTTLVLALIKGADVYIAHLGDSRAYRVSQHNCQQVTLDDDVASRQVRLGSNLYREVLVQPGSGSLIQALGMGSSQSLHPTVQRFVVDQSCVFLLCSDGLSDGDRVEQFWQQLLQPLVTTDDLPVGSVAKVGQHLVDLANKYNGHDNVTVGLLRAQVVSASERIVPRDLVSTATRLDVTFAEGETTLLDDSTQPLQPRPQTQLMSSSETSPTAERSRTGSANDAKAGSAKLGKRLPLLALALLLLAVAGGILYFLFPGVSSRSRSLVVNSSPQSVSPDAPSATSETAVRTPADLAVGSYARIRQSQVPQPSDTDGGGFAPLALYPDPAARSSPNAIAGTIPTGAIVRVVSKQTADDQAQWVQLQLCSIPSGESLSDVPVETVTGGGVNQPETTQTDQPLLLAPGSEGWIVESEVAAVAEQIQSLEPTQRGSCQS